MDAGARWNTPLQTLHFVLSVALCTIPNYSVLIKFSSTFCLECCLVYNTELFTAHQILNFHKKNFRRVDIVTKITKFFTTKIWSYTITKKRPLQPYLALYVQFSWHTLFTKATPTKWRIRHDFNCHINERETPETCLTNHKGSISHHIMPLVINSPTGGHTHTHIQTSQTKAISRNQARASLWLVCTWFKK